MIRESLQKKPYSWMGKCNIVKIGRKKKKAKKTENIFKGKKNIKMQITKLQRKKYFYMPNTRMTSHSSFSLSSAFLMCVFFQGHEGLQHKHVFSLLYSHDSLILK